MKIKADKRGEVLVLELSGVLSIGSGDVALRDAVQEALNEGWKKLVLDLGGLRSVDSSGFGELVGVYATTVNRGGQLALANLPPKIVDVLTVTQLISVFEIFPATEDAVEELKARPLRVI